MALLTDEMLVRGYCTCSVESLALPIALLKVHVATTSKQANELEKQIGIVKSRLSEPRRSDGDENDRSIESLAAMTMLLYRSESELMRLERGARFEVNLTASIAQYMGAELSSEATNRDVSAYLGYPLVLPRNLIQIRQDSLDSFSKRIASQRLMISNLILQRDQRISIRISHANLQIAASSREIAKATMSDSASMKTIAVLTMVFLPGTAVASIFSTSMFNWNAPAGQSLTSNYLWIYFAVAIPLTALVLSVWWTCYRHRRNTLHRNLLGNAEEEAFEMTAMRDAEANGGVISPVSKPRIFKQMRR